MCRRNQASARGEIQRQRVRQEAYRLSPWCPAHTALEGLHTAGTQPGTFRQRLLRQPHRQPEAAQETPKRLGTVGRHSSGSGSTVTFEIGKSRLAAV
jgi:hypothetical protein